MEILLARQPIFDCQEQLVGYELFYRDTADAESSEPARAGETADRAILQACLDHGFEQMADGKPAFLRVSRDMLLDRSVRLIDPRRAVLQLSGSGQIDGELLAACRELVQEGYGFALSGIPRSSGSEQLLRLCTVVKIDVGSSSPREIAPLLEPLREHGVRLLGERVPNRTVRDECVALGFELFQGYRFHRLEARATRDLPIDHLQTFRLMKDLQNPAVSDSKIEDGFRRDVALTYKLLRMVNSASAGGSGIYSIGHAIRLLGRNTLYRWLSLLLLSSIAERGVDAEVARASLLRGRLCELIALASGIPKAGGPLFIVGVLSLLDVLLGLPMEELATRMELAPDVRRALLTREDFYGATLALVEAYEEGCWDEVMARCGEVGVQPHVLRGLYFVSLEWAREQLGEAVK